MLEIEEGGHNEDMRPLLALEISRLGKLLGLSRLQRLRNEDIRSQLQQS